MMIIISILTLITINIVTIIIFVGDFKSSFSSNTNSTKQNQNQRSTSSTSSSSSSSQPNANANGNNNIPENQNHPDNTNYRAIIEGYGESVKNFFSKILSRIILFFTQLSEQNKMIIGVVFLGILFYFLIHAGDTRGGGMWGSRVDRGRGRGRGDRSNVGEAYNHGSDSSFDQVRAEREREGLFDNKNNQDFHDNDSRKKRTSKASSKEKEERGAEAEAEAAAGIHGYSTRANTKRKKEYNEKFPSPSPFSSPSPYSTPSYSSSPSSYSTPPHSSPSSFDSPTPTPIRSNNYDDTYRNEANREIPQYNDKGNYGNNRYQNHNYDDSSFFGNFGYIFDTAYGLSWPLWTAILAGAYKIPPYFPDQLGPHYARPFFGMTMANFTMYLQMFSNQMRGRGRERGVGAGFGGLGGIANMFNRRRY